MCYPCPVLLIGLAMGGFLGFLTSFYTLNTNIFYWVTLLCLTAQLILMGLAVAPLLHEQRKVWSLVFTAARLSIVTVITNLCAQFISPLWGTLASVVALIAIFYVLFQLRSYYSR